MEGVVFPLGFIGAAFQKQFEFTFKRYGPATIDGLNLSHGWFFKYKLRYIFFLSIQLCNWLSLEALDQIHTYGEDM